MNQFHTRNLDLIFREDGLIKQNKPDYSERPSQIEAAHEIFNTFIDNGIQIVEGPCGFGKTFSYLVPLFEYLHQCSVSTKEEIENTMDNSENCKGDDYKAVIVTNGISLQEQLYHKDLPMVQKLFSEIYSKKKSFAILKGKSNFVCIKKMSETMAKIFAPADKSGDHEKNKELAIQWSKIVNWYQETSVGDFAELDFIPDDIIAQEISCSEDGECIGKGCPMYGECFYQAHKIKAFCSDIIITNYHVLFWDLELGGNMLLPRYNYIVFDEAHEIADIYRDFKSNKFSIFTLWGIRNGIKRLINKYELADGLMSKFYESSNEKEYPYLEVYNALEDNTELLMDNLYRANFKDANFAENKIIDANFQLPDVSVIIELLDDLRLYLGHAAEYCAQKIEAASGSGIPAGDDVYACSGGFGRLYEKCKKIKELLNDCNISKYKDDVVFWIDKKEAKKDDTEKSMRISINYCPVDVSDQLYNAFFKKSNLSAVLTSATLSVGGEFKYIKNLLGLELASKEQRFVNTDGTTSIYPPRKIREFVGSSPFNLTEQQLWYLPKTAVEGNSKEFDKTITSILFDTIFQCRGGALCLFTSVKNMNDAYYTLRNSLVSTGIPVLKQGDMPKGKLLEAFRDDRNSTLFATRSFFTGVDIPGDSLRCLIVDKLPFPSPGDPVMQKLSKQDGAFYKYYIPMMIITLKQAIGRGVRSITDKCIICVMDNRMATARYKTTINNSFKYEKTGTRDLKDLSKFLGLEDRITEEWNKITDDELPF